MAERIRKQPPKNILPYDGEAIYFGPIFNEEKADAYLRYLLQDISWKNDEAVLFGKHYVTKRKVAWYGDMNYAYTYSKKTRVALPWTDELLKMKRQVESFSNVTYNSCLLNLYPSGEEGMGWHHDDEKALGTNANIASVSFGAVRRFDLRHKHSKEKVSIELEHGSLLVMQGTTQTFWQHHIPKTKKVAHPRVNLTFRTMIN